MTFATVDGHRSAVLLDDGLHTCQTSTGSAEPAHRIATAVEALENVRQVRLGDAYAGVAHGDGRMVDSRETFAPDLDDDLSAARAVLDRVADQVADRAFETRRVPVAMQWRLLRVHADAVLGRLLSVVLGNAAYQLDNVGALAS